jgi:hypothetical protein
MNAGFPFPYLLLRWVARIERKRSDLRHLDDRWRARLLCLEESGLPCDYSPTRNRANRYLHIAPEFFAPLPAMNWPGGSSHHASRRWTDTHALLWWLQTIPSCLLAEL